jgi:hypothetical protein
MILATCVIDNVVLGMTMAACGNEIMVMTDRLKTENVLSEYEKQKFLIFDLPLFNLH